MRKYYDIQTEHLLIGVTRKEYLKQKEDLSRHKIAHKERIDVYKTGLTFHTLIVLEPC